MKIPRAGVAVLLLAAACHRSSDDSGAAAPPAPPPPFNVISTTPSSGAGGVATNSTILVTFDADVDTATLVSANFTVTAGGGPVGGAFSYDAPSRTATFTPTAALAPATLHTVSLTAGLLSVGGGALNPSSFQFTTAAAPDTLPPTFGGAAAATPENAFRITVSWTAATDNQDAPAAIRYRIYRATTTMMQNFASTLATTSPGALAYTDNAVLAGTGYFYVVRAVDSAGNEETNTFERSTSTPLRRTWAGDVYPIIVATSCVGCHGFSGGLTLDPIATAYGELTLPASSAADGGCSALKRVQAFSSAASHFFKKLEGTQT